MSYDKAEVKKGAIEEIGNLLDDALEVAKHEVHAAAGSKKAFDAALVSIINLSAHVDADVDEGKFDLEVCTVVKRYLTRAQQMIKNLLLQAGKDQLKFDGQVTAYEKAVIITKKQYDIEDRKAKMLECVEGAPGEKIVEFPERRGVGVPPKQTLKEQRLAEDAKVEKKKPPAKKKTRTTAKPKAAKKRRSKKETAGADNP
jgi:hypothetical protein